MNREQAEHILEAYVQMRMHESDKDAADALREVILDVMSEYTTAKLNYPIITYPYTTWAERTKQPTNTDWDSTPKVTYTGIDPAFGINTAEVKE